MVLDLAGSNKSNVKEATDYDRNTPEGKNIWFGVREFAMGVNGMAHGGLHPYGATFFVFSDYLKPRCVYHYHGIKFNIHLHT